MAFVLLLRWYFYHLPPCAVQYISLWMHIVAPCIYDACPVTRVGVAKQRKQQKTKSFGRLRGHVCN